MSDYAALAQRVAAGISGIRGCVLLSRDGMVLGAHPEGELESQTKAAWLRFASLGEPERSYVEFPDQTWAYVRRGAYAIFAVAEAAVRPGLLVDLLDQVLMAGEVERIQEREAMRVPDPPAAPSGKPRTILHKPERTPAAQPVVVQQVRIPEAGEPDPAGAVPAPGSGSTPASDADASPREGQPEGDEAGAPAAGDAVPEPEEETEVDRILLAKEFAGLLQVPRDDDEASR